MSFFIATPLDLVLIVDGRRVAARAHAARRNDKLSANSVIDAIENNT
jgi:hypothetical protein